MILTFYQKKGVFCDNYSKGKLLGILFDKQKIITQCPTLCSTVYPVHVKVYSAIRRAPFYSMSNESSAWAEQFLKISVGRTAGT